MRAADGSWVCDRALSVQTAFIHGVAFAGNELTFRFYDDVVMPEAGPHRGEYYRAIFQGGRLGHSWEYEGGAVVLSVLDREQSLQAVGAPNP